MAEFLRQKLETAYKLLEGLPEEQARSAQVALLAAWDIAAAMNGQWTELAGMIVQQRDQALTELQGIVTALRDVDYKNPLVSHLLEGLYDQVMEEHNANFWDSLPYDVATTLGKGWSHMDAQTLVDLIIDHDDWEDEDWAQDHGWTWEDMQAAREIIRAAVRNLDESADQ